MCNRFSALSVVAAVALVSLPATVQVAEPARFGAGVTLEASTPIAELIARPASFEGKTVRVEGVVTAVCTHMGCWMALAADQDPNGHVVRLKVDDGVIVFPVSAKGKRAVAQGVVERVGNDPEGQEAAAEQAKATGKTADPFANWQIKTTGALVY